VTIQSIAVEPVST